MIMKLYRSILYLVFVFVLLQTGCSKTLSKEYFMDRDIIIVFNSQEWSKRREWNNMRISASTRILYFTNFGNFIISSSIDEEVENYQLNIISNSIKFQPYVFEKGTKTNCLYNAQGIYPPVYPKEEVEKLLQKNEYVVAGIKVEEDFYIMNIISNDSYPECGIGYFGFYDRKELKRKFLKYENFPVTLFEVDGSGLNGFSYDRKRNSIFFCGRFVNSDKTKKYWGIHLFRYSMSDDKLYLIKYGNPLSQKKDIILIPGTDYLMFWDDGVVLKRIEK